MGLKALIGPFHGLFVQVSQNFLMRGWLIGGGDGHFLEEKLMHEHKCVGSDVIECKLASYLPGDAPEFLLSVRDDSLAKTVSLGMSHLE